ncbi:metallopeptidase TldD-related protein [Sphingomonas sp. SM33]|uniref:Metallopeptidase TldD-related protein n=1 Tax=Sphingomonas telluris TaxID=2907998 RepID=A0ABS9VP53_9SPHN|nr:metallopeptidase TldD-related protein [Sphingomonas telluris]MCH8616284.1 metallopeptidase TldD-related protein [Sphingomonas telluris]
MLPIEQARAIAESLVEQARAAGADTADAIYAASESQSVQVRLGELEHVDRSEGEEVGLRAFIGQRSATVSSSDFSPEALRELVTRVIAMAREAPEDPFAGLAPAELLQRGTPPDVQSEDSQGADPEAMRSRALEAERAALGVPQITNSSGASAGSSASTVALATSTGFSGAYRATGHSVSASVIAGEGATMQRDSAWHGTRHLEDLDPAEQVGWLSGERAVARLNPGKPKPGRYPVLFDPRVAGSLITHFAGAITGGAVARKSSFLQDKLGESIFGAGVTITDDPLRFRGLRSRPFDGEGLPVAQMDLVADGVLRTWTAESASARQLGIQPTGHAVRGTSGAPGAGPTNLFLAPGKRSRDELLTAFPEALLIIELIGQGVNPVTGDYSRGAVGFMVRNGEIAEPVAEITIASNLIDMFATLEPGSDLEFRRGIDSPTILIPEMTVAAA